MTPTVRMAAALAAVVFTLFQLPARIVSAQEPGQSVGARSAASSGIYIVQMADSPAGSYAGGVAGLPATKASRGNKLDPNDTDVIRYGAYLQTKHDEALARVGGGRKVYDYRYSFNGFAAELSEAQAAALRSAPGVLAVTKDELVTGDTSSTPTFLGLDADGGLWDQAG